MPKKEDKKAGKTSRDFQVSLTMTKPSEGQEAILERALAVSEQRVKDLQKECDELKEYKGGNEIRDARIALLERRCLTLQSSLEVLEGRRQQGGRMLTAVMALQQQGVDEINKFSLRALGVLDRVAELVGGPVTMCPACGRLAKVHDRTGLFYCDECFDRAPWPWEAPWSKSRGAK